MINDYEQQSPHPGSHQGDAESLESGMTVRAPQAPDDRPPQPDADVVFQLARHSHKGFYRMRRWGGGQEPSLDEGYQEVHRYGHEDYMDAFSRLSSESYYLVFENTDTGQVFLGGMNNLSDNWTASGDFDQITIFEREADAAAYAKEREESLDG